MAPQPDPLTAALIERIAVNHEGYWKAAPDADPVALPLHHLVGIASKTDPKGVDDFVQAVNAYLLMKVPMGLLRQWLVEDGAALACSWGVRARLDQERREKIAFRQWQEDRIREFEKKAAREKTQKLDRRPAPAPAAKPPPAPEALALDRPLKDAIAKVETPPPAPPAPPTDAPPEVTAEGGAPAMESPDPT